MVDAKYVDQTSRTLSPLGEDTVSRIIFEKGIVVSCIGWQMGKSAIVRRRAVTNQQVNTIIVDETKVDLDFLYYVLKSKREEIFQLGATATRTPIVKKSLFERVSFKAPDLSDQNKIASILNSLDDKIELNRQINTTLESMAQALFKSWFVDFDPVIDNALAAGNRNAGRRIPDELQARFERRRQLRENPDNPHPPLPADIQQLFPSSFVFTEEMGWVPEGWELVELKSLTQKIGSGATPRGGQKVYQESGISLIRSQNVYDSNFVWDGLAYISDEAATQLKNVEVMSGDVLINITGASILRTCIVEPTVLPARVNQHVAIIRPKEGIPSKYLHLHLLNPRTKNHLMGQNAGGSREAVTKGHLESVPTLRPSDKVLNSFEGQTLALGDKSFSIGANTKVLESIRNSLLPKLLSGQLQIPEAKQQLAEVI